MSGIDEALKNFQRALEKQPVAKCEKCGEEGVAIGRPPHYCENCAKGRKKAVSVPMRPAVAPPGNRFWAPRDRSDEIAP